MPLPTDLFDNDGLIDLDRADMNAIIKYYAMQVGAAFMEKGFGGISSVLREFYVLLARRRDATTKDLVNASVKLAEAARHNPSYRSLCDDVSKAIEKASKS